VESYRCPLWVNGDVTLCNHDVCFTPLGLTKTPIASFLIWTAIGIFPGTVVDIYIGIVGAQAADGAQLAYLIIGLIATALIAVLILIKARC
jgi:membrane protein DedA with SNARE-associated domain